MRRKVTGALLVAASGLTPVVEAAGSEDVTWFGDLTTGKTVVTVRLKGVSVRGATAPPKFDLVPRGPFDVPVTDVSVASSSETMTLELGGERLRLTVPIAGDRAAGDVYGGDAAAVGSFTFRRLQEGPPPETVEGIYRSEETTAVISRFGEYGPGLFLLDLGTGDVGPLHPVGPGKLFWGASVGTPAFPERAEVQVRMDPDGSGGVTLEIARSGKAAQRLVRQRLHHRDVRFRSGAIELAGTITRPRSGSPVPAIVLVHGSGPADRHALGPWTYYFAAQGLAVLAYDKRGVEGSSGDWKTATLEELAADAGAAVACLRTEPGVAPRRVGVWGASQGGWIVPQVAAHDPGVSFVLVHAGAAVTPAEQGLQALAAELRAYEFEPAEIERALVFYRLNDEVTRGRRPWAEYKAAYDEAAARKVEWIPGPPDPEDSWFRRLYRGLMDFDPRPYWAKVRCPVLAFFGGRDRTVLVDPNAEMLRAALGGKASLTIEVLPTANHLLFEATKGVSAEYVSSTRFDPRYFELMAAWLKTRTGPGSR